ncbi:MAG: M20/M25/M40 family metallo-hydrolase [Methyloligellaceae bacterium]
MQTSRNAAIDRSQSYYDDEKQGYFCELADLVALRTESQNPDRIGDLKSYLLDTIRPKFENLDYSCEIFDQPNSGMAPVLLASRIEQDDFLTVLGYGHGDVILGQENAWSEGLSPWELRIIEDRVYGRGTADNKGQHLAHLVSLESVLKTRGQLGFNSKFIIEMGEEKGSVGFRQFVADNLSRFSADVFFASDGPRVSVKHPNITLGNRGVINFELVCELREGSHHSGNWGGALSNPGIRLAHALASMVSAEGRLRVEGWHAGPVPENVHDALAKLVKEPSSDAPAVDIYWGEEDRSTLEKVTASNSFEVLAFKTGDPEKPVNAIPGKANATCQLRFVVGTDRYNIVENLRTHLDMHGFDDVKITEVNSASAIHFDATRTDPDNPWAVWVRDSVERTIQGTCGVLPNSGGSNVTEVMQYDLDIPTVWLPLSHEGCSQHAPDEHILKSMMREGVAFVTGVYWDLGDSDLAFK